MSTYSTQDSIGEKLMSLSGCSIAVSGKFPGYTQGKLLPSIAIRNFQRSALTVHVTKLKLLVTSSGAKFEVSGVTSTTTHLITPQPDFYRPSLKCTISVYPVVLPDTALGSFFLTLAVGEAWAKKIPVVSLDWLLDSASKNKRQGESNYSYRNPQQASGSRVDDVKTEVSQVHGKKRKKAEPKKRLRYLRRNLSKDGEVKRWKLESPLQMMFKTR